jgi:hypothetical protein
VIYVLAVETPTGGLTVFTSPMPWAAGTATPTINGLTKTQGFTELSTTQVQFSVPPQIGDVVGFFVQTI